MKEVIKIKKSNKCNKIYLEDGGTILTNDTIMYFYEVREGSMIDEIVVRKESEKAVYRMAYNDSIRYLEKTDKTVFQICAYLVRLGYDELAVERVIKNLKEQKYLDDYKYAVRYIDKKLRRDFIGHKKIFYELSKKGVEEDIIEKSLESYTKEDEEKKILEFIEVYSNRYNKYSYFEKVNKLMNAGQRKGFEKERLSEGIIHVMGSYKENLENDFSRERAIKIGEKIIEEGKKEGLNDRKIQYRIFREFYKKNYSEDEIEDIIRDLYRY